MGLKWLNKPVMWHSSRISGGYPETLTEYEIWLKGTRFRNWYSADWDYGLTTVYFFVAGIALFTLINVFSSFRSKSYECNSLSRRLLNKAKAAFRFCKARQFHVARFQYYSPSLGAILVILCISVFIIALTFGTTPYYWPTPDLGHSPPLATRTGWISIAIMPFMIMFATKFNPIGMLTGVSHEHLQVYHRWAATIMYITSLLHTFPFIIFNIQEGTMVKHYKADSWYWTGIAALIPQTWLVTMSWGFFRNRYYEIFKKLHFIASGIFMVFLFIHCNFRLTSWDYFLATLTLYGLFWMFRHLGIAMSRNGLDLVAQFEAISEDMVKVNIATNMYWEPGQHVIVRFLGLGIHAFSSHPFTVASLTPDRSLDLYIRVHDGLTRRLLSNSALNRSCGVLIDGPYGGLAHPLRDFERVMLLAGGSGVSFTLPLLRDVVRSFKKDIKCKSVLFVLAVPSLELLSWLEKDLIHALDNAPGHSVVVEIYVTGDIEKKTEEVADSELPTRQGRPDLPMLIQEFCTTGSSVGIATCGPPSFTYDCRNAVAKAQADLIGGNSACQDIFLHAEAYSW